MRHPNTAVAAVLGTLLFASLAQAHEIRCEERVNNVGASVITHYPATVSFEVEIFNTHPTDASVVLDVKEPFLQSFGRSPLPPTPLTIPVGGSVRSEALELSLPDEATCLRLAASDGRLDDVIETTLYATTDMGAAQCSTRISCRPTPPNPPGVTRSTGFYKVYEQPLQACLGTPVDLGFVTINTLAQALGLFWGSPVRDDLKHRRTAEDQARFLLGRQALAAICNERLFRTPAPSNLLEEAVEALKGTDAPLMLGLAGQLEAYNDSGENLGLPAGFMSGPATPKHARSIALDPAPRSHRPVCSSSP